MQNRRNFLQRSAIALNLLLVGACQSSLAWAVEEKRSKAFEARDLASALAVLGVQNPGPGKRILLDVPEIADKDANILIKVRSAIPNTDWIAVLIDKREFPLVDQFDLVGSKTHEIEVKAKLAQTTSVIAVVRADSKYYRVDKEVKVALADCK